MLVYLRILKLYSTVRHIILNGLMKSLSWLTLSNVLLASRVGTNTALFRLPVSLTLQRKLNYRHLFLRIFRRPMAPVHIRDIMQTVHTFAYTLRRSKQRFHIPDVSQQFVTERCQCAMCERASRPGEGFCPDTVYIVCRSLYDYTVPYHL